MTIDVGKFKPHPFIWGGHLQTLFPALRYRFKKMPFDRIHYVARSGEDQVTILENQPQGGEVKQAAVLLVHGLGSSAHQPGLVRHAQLLQQLGYRVYRMNHRGISEGRGLSREIYHADRHDDIASVVEHLVDHEGCERLIIVGYSMSANMVLKLLGYAKAASWPYLNNIHRSVCISPATDMQLSARAVSYSLLGLYNRLFVADALKYLKRRESHYEGTRPANWRQLRRLLDVDEKYVCLEAGHNDVATYYESCSPVKWLKDISTDTVVLCAKDDPIAINDHQLLEQHTNLKVYSTDTGGHLGFIGRKNGSLRSHPWIDNFVVQAVEGAS